MYERCQTQINTKISESLLLQNPPSSRVLHLSKLATFDNFDIAKCIIVLISRALARNTESFLFHIVTFVEEASALLIDIIQFVMGK